MDHDMYGLSSTSSDYCPENAFMLPENLIIPTEYHNSFHDLISFGDHFRNSLFGLYDVGFQCTSEVASVNPQSSTAEKGTPEKDENIAENSSLIKKKISSHPSYPKLLDAYLDCQKVGLPPEIASLLDGIRQEREFSRLNEVSTGCLGVDPELDDFMETYYDILVKYKTDLSKPFNEATSFLSKIEAQLGTLCKDDGVLSSDEEFSGMTEVQDVQIKSEDQELKDKLMLRYGSQIHELKQEFSKKKKNKAKLPNEARKTLLEWWNTHDKWPYPTEADKVSLAELTGLDQKQINNWFINQRKRHWKPTENMQLAVMDNVSGQFLIHAD